MIFFIINALRKIVYCFLKNISIILKSELFSSLNSRIGKTLRLILRRMDAIIFVEMAGYRPMRKRSLGRTLFQ